ncbi:MAG: prepilin peptidase [Deltaproteobacteria bacterium]|nr:MAG: prepilin peptidase [Deltaproteobacteria bacterium]
MADTTVLTWMLLVGAAMGSFAALVVSRLPRGESLVTPASHCEACGLRLPWFCNVPLLSYIVLRGRCHRCKASIAPRLFWCELLMAALFGALWVRFGLSYALLHSVMLWGAIYFRRRHVIKTTFLIFGSLLGLALINRQVVMALIPGSRPVAPFADVWVAKGGQALALPDNQWHLLMALLPLALALLLWAAAYARLTEKQL